MTASNVQIALFTTARHPTAKVAQDLLTATLASFDTTDWNTLIEQAMAHGTTALLCRCLLNLDPGLLPGDLAAACTTYLEAREIAAELAIAQLDSVLGALAASEIKTLPYKGPVLGIQAYGDPAVREFRDLDFLIRPEDVARALAILGELGYRSEAIVGLRTERVKDYYRYNGHDILFAPGQRFPLEPHWALSPLTFCVDLPTMPIFERAVVVETPKGGYFSCFSPEDTLLAAAVHGGKEQWTRLIWVADIAALLHSHREIDWMAILDRGKQLGCLRMALLAAELARRFLDASLPDHVLAAIARDAAVTRLSDVVGAGLTPHTDTPSVFRVTPFRWRMRERFADRFRYASRTLLTARVPHFRNVDLPDRLSFLYPAVRLGQDFLVLPAWRALHGHGNGVPLQTSGRRRPGI